MARLSSTGQVVQMVEWSVKAGLFLAEVHATQDARLQIEVTFPF